MNHYPTLRATAIAAALLASAIGASAQETKSELESSSVPTEAQKQFDVASAAAKKAVDALGIQLWGYMRAGAYYAADGLNKGKYGLGEMGYNRLGNEGDQYLEFGIGKKWNLSGAKLGTYWMPYLYNAACCNQNGTKQVYVDITGLGIAPSLTFWGGQRYHRIQDIHIIDNWIMEDGDNFGAGVDGIMFGKKGEGTLNLAVYTEGNTDNDKTTSNAKRFNLQARDIPVAPGGTLNLTGAVIRGSFNDKRTSFALGALYNQKFGTTTNSVFLQGSNGHANLSGKFYNLNGTATTTVGSPFICTTNPNPDGSCPTQNIAPNPAQTTVTSTTYNPGAQQFRLIESLVWQNGPFGGQAFIGYQTLKPSDTDTTTKNLGIGARLSYGIARNVKLYGDVNLSSLKTDGSDQQRVDKETIAIALAPNTDFWTRPEIRLYVSRVGGNSAAKATNMFNGRSGATLAGIQVEAWWE